jgi:hypothetical protein
MPRHEDITIRFWRHVDRSGDCWLWTGTVAGFGHGWVRVGGKATGDRRRSIAAHRLSWELAYGPIPAGMCVLHRCDVPRCVRPAHLFLGTKRDNTQDMIAKGRSRLSIGGPVRRGEDSRWARLTEDQVRWLRRMVGRISQNDAAWLLGIRQSQVSRIILGKRWAHVHEVQQ